MIRDLTKSTASFSLGMSLFGLKQMTNLLMPQGPDQPVHRVAGAFDAVTQAAEAQLDDTLKGVFKVGDQMQKGAVDLMSGFVTLDVLNPSQLMRMASDMMSQSMGGSGQGMGMPGGASEPNESEGWGPIPPP